MTEPRIDRRRFIRGTLAAGVALGAPLPLRAWGDEAFSYGDLDATAMARAVRAGDITPTALVESARDAIEQLNPRLNAIVTTFYEHAFELAAESDRQGPFAGVPYVIKDLSEYAGFRTTFGSRIGQNHISKKTHPVIEAALQTGLIPVGKSNTPEYGQLPTTEPLAYGATRNPWNLEYSAGGSSGVSGAAVASGMVPIASASDGGGSIRIPACHCGVFGLKVTRGRNVAADPSPMAFSVRGAISRSVRDSAAHAVAVQQTGGNAPWQPIDLVTGPAKRRLKIGLLFDGIGHQQPSDEVRAAILETAELCRSLGHTVSEATFPDSVHAMGIRMMDATSKRIAGIGQFAAQQLGRPADEREFEPWTLQMIEYSNNVAPELFEQSVAHLTQQGRDTQAMFERFDVVLMPILTTRPAKIGAFASTPDVSFEEMLRRNQAYVAYTTAFNVSGNPAMSVPLYWTQDDLPIGSHFAAGMGQEATLLGLAYELEEARPWKDRHPPISIWSDT